jgi:hypothetical protein
MLLFKLLQICQRKVSGQLYSNLLELHNSTRLSQGHWHL